MTQRAVAYAPLNIQRDAVQKIAVFRALFLGDLLCTVPAFRALRRRYPQAEITLIGLPWAAEFVERVPYLDRFVAFPGYDGLQEVSYKPGQTEAFLRSSQAAGYDIALQMHGDGHVSNGFVGALGARLSLGYRQGADERLGFSLPYEQSQHEVLRWLRLVAALDAPVDDHRIELLITDADARQAARLLADMSSGPLVALHAGAKDQARRWSPERFAAVGDALVERFCARVVLTGSAGEREITAAVQRAMRYPALDLAGATDLGTFAAVLRRVDLLLSNDTGASHVAAATGTRSVVLFGPSRPEQWAPLDRERHQVIDAAALSGSDPSIALQHLPVEPVLSACIEALRNKGNKETKEQVRG
ncbi:MAG TPA: glycosyltransferase family 9 protein [Herpetosiphonaceae bacterium]